jgi:hypothetical protein
LLTGDTPESCAKLILFSITKRGDEMLIKINELYSLENISDCYYIDENMNVINVNTGHIKTQTLGKRGYYYVSLNEKVTNRQVKVYMHKIISLAFLGNIPHEAVNHMDGNKLNNDVSNLEYCTLKYNTQHAFRTGLIPIRAKRYRLIQFRNLFYAIFEGTLKEISNMISIPFGTLYDILRKDEQYRNTYNIMKIELIE